MYTFEVSRPGTLAEAQAALAAYEDASLLAGGQTLVPTLKLRLARPDALVDLSGIAQLCEISLDDDVRIGAMATHAEVASHRETASAIPALARLAASIGDPAVRNLGTIGGSIANSDPAADYPAAVLGLGAIIHTTNRSIAADDYFKGLFETALEDGEIITTITFPRPEKAAYAKFPHPASRYALVGVMAAQTASGARVAVTGAGPCAFRVPAMEQALDADWSVDAVAAVTLDADGLNSDMHGSARYRAHLITVLAERAVAAAS